MWEFVFLVRMVSKEVFAGVLDSLREQYERDKDNAFKIKGIFGGDIHLYDNGLLVASVIRLLQEWFPKDGDFCEIENWCFERDYGKVLMHDEENGYEIERETAEMLYDRLTGQIEENGNRD